MAESESAVPAFLGLPNAHAALVGAGVGAGDGLEGGAGTRSQISTRGSAPWMYTIIRVNHAPLLGRASKPSESEMKVVGCIYSDTGVMVLLFLPECQVREARREGA